MLGATMSGVSEDPLGLVVVGTLLLVVVGLRVGAQRLRWPPFAGFLLVGIALGALHLRIPVLSPNVRQILGFLADAGLVVLLFRVGLQSDLGGLFREFPTAARIWLGDVVVSAAAAWGTAHYLLGLDLVATLFVTVSLTATSVGIAVASWSDADALSSEEGEILVDTAELDDVSAVVLLALLIAVLPVLQGDASGGGVAVVRVAGTLLVKFVGFIALGLLFGRYLEPLTGRFFERRGSRPGPLLLIVGTGFLIAGVSELLGFSVAIGAFFAGIMYSRDPNAQEIERAFEPFYAFFTPFFFIGIGIAVDPRALAALPTVGGLLLVAAVAGKLVGAGVPAAVMVGRTSGLVIGVSMVPRAEVALLAVERGHAMGVVPEEVFAGMAAVSLVTAITVPLLLTPLLRSWTAGRTST